LRRLGVVALGAPVIGLVYLRAALRRSAALRIALVVAIGGLLAGGSIAALGTGATAARPPIAIAPMAPAAFTTTLRTSVGLREGVTIRFDRPMDAASVAAAVTVAPPAPVSLALAADGRSVVVRPTSRWETGTFYTVSIGTQARAVDGAALDRPARAAFVTRPGGSAALGPVATADGGPAMPAITIRSDVPIASAAVEAALRIEPVVPLLVDVDGPVGEPTTTFHVRPASALGPGSTYRVSLSAGLVDLDGAPVATGSSIVVGVPAAPSVVRFRPVGGATDVAAGAALSVRFSEPMNRATTTSAFTVTADGAPVAFRSTRWAEGSRVLVAVPASPFAAGATVTVQVAATATSATGIALGSARSASFVVHAAKVPASPTPAAPRPRAPTPAPKPAPSGTSAGTATWYAVETYYLKLMNCTRTGGWVTSTGSCSSPGGRNVAPLALSAGISSKVSRPYAKYLATHGACDHFIGGSPGDRLRRAGYTSYRWAENIGCRSGDPYAAVLGSHLYFQNEKPYNGGHYVNLMNALYDRAGIGVWVSSGRVRLVVDFYHP
jgi:uncharacterized protein YkwD